jgi:PUL domain
MGQMLRPMLEQMTAELNGADPMNGSTAAAAAPPATPAAAPAAARSVPVPVLSHHPAVPVAQGTTGDAPPGQIYTLLSSHTKPLLSADASIAGTVLTRLQPSAAAALTSDDTAVLTQFQKALLSGLSTPLPDTAYTVLTKVLTQCDAAEFLVLCLLRLAVLHPATSAQQTEQLAAVEAVAQRLAVSKGAGFKSPQGLAMGLCTCANMFATASGTVIMTSPTGMPRCFDAALEALQHARVDVRQLAAALTFNYALALTSAAAADSDEMSDAVTQLLLSSIEGLSDEADDLVALRRLMTAGCIMRKYKGACSELIEACDLGHHVHNFHQGSPATGKAKHLAAEIVQLLNCSS